MRLSSLFIAAAALAASPLSAIPVLPRHGTLEEVFVNCNTGSDETGDGLRDNPLRSPMAARDILRRIHPLGRPAVVEVSGDCFPVGLNFSQAVLELEAQDSGSPDAVITYRASKAGARLLGGFQVLGGFQACPCRVLTVGASSFFLTWRLPGAVRGVGGRGGGAGRARSRPPPRQGATG